MREDPNDGENCGSWVAMSAKFSMPRLPIVSRLTATVGVVPPSSGRRMREPVTVTLCPADAPSPLCATAGVHAVAPPRLVIAASTAHPMRDLLNMCCPKKRSGHGPDAAAPFGGCVPAGPAFGRARAL